MQARFPRERVQIDGRATCYVRVADHGEEREFFFCPECDSTVYYWTDAELIAVPIGAFADPSFPPPAVSVWESQRHPWVSVPAADRDDH